MRIITMAIFWGMGGGLAVVMCSILFELAKPAPLWAEVLGGMTAIGATIWAAKRSL